MQYIMAEFFLQKKGRDIEVYDKLPLLSQNWSWQVFLSVFGILIESVIGFRWQKVEKYKYKDKSSWTNKKNHTSIRFEGKNKVVVLSRSFVP